MRRERKGSQPGMHLMLLQQLSQAVQRQRRMGSERRSTAANRSLLACASAHFCWDLMKRPLFSLSHVILRLLPVDHNTCSIELAILRRAEIATRRSYGVGLQTAEFAAGLHLFPKRKSISIHGVSVFCHAWSVWGGAAKRRVCSRSAPFFFPKERASRGMVYPCMVQLARDTFHADGG